MESLLIRPQENHHKNKNYVNEFSYEKKLELIERFYNQFPSEVSKCRNLQDIEKLALAKLNINAISYFISGANSEFTLNRNKDYFKKILIKPKIFKKTNQNNLTYNSISLKTKLFNEELEIPIGISPSALHRLASNPGEKDTAKASLMNDSIFILSSRASTTLEEVAQVNKNGLRWFQLYAMKNMENNEILIKEAEKFGFKALVLTVDAPTIGYRDRDFQLGFKKPQDIDYAIEKNLLEIKLNKQKQKTEQEMEKEQAAEKQIKKNNQSAELNYISSIYSNKSLDDNKNRNSFAGNILSKKANSIINRVIINIKNNGKKNSKKEFPVISHNNLSQSIGINSNKSSEINKKNYANNKSNLNTNIENKFNFNFYKNQTDSSLDWNIISSLKTITKLPIILKGISNAFDAIKAAEFDVDGIIVSNHGGRQLDTCPATIEVFESIADKLNLYYEKYPNKKRLELMIDSGFRKGEDIYKALALGAKAVFLGRPIIWGLAAGGAAGVDQVFRILKHELKLTMLYTGCESIEEISKQNLILNSPNF